MNISVETQQSSYNILFMNIYMKGYPRRMILKRRHKTLKKNEIPRVKFSLLILILSLSGYLKGLERLNLRKQLSSMKSGQSSLKFYLL